MSDFNIPVAEPLKVQAAIPRVATYTMAMAIVTVVIYILGPSVAVNLAALGGLLAVSVIGLIVLGNQERKANYAGGYMSYGTAFQLLMLMSVGSVLATQIIQFIWFTVVDPTMPEAMAAASVQQTLSMMGSAAENLEGEALEQIETQTLEGLKPSVFSLLKGIGMGVLVSAILNALLALGVRKKVPVMQ
jgi:Co/Zn/Cd efflux system component